MNDHTLIYQAGWQFAVTCLWPARRLSAFELLITQRKIRQIISESEDNYLGYLAFCQQILLFRNYAVTSGGAVAIPSPYNFFRSGRGFALAKIFFRSLQEKRKSEPLCMHNLKGLCEAVLEITEDDSEDLLIYWENWFRERKALSELRLLLLYSVKFSFKTLRS